MSEDLIRRSDAIKVIEAEECLGYVECQSEWLFDRIRKIPTIEPKQGEWITYYPIMMSIEDQKFYGAQNPTEPIPDKRFPRIKCSVCGGARPLGEDNFCPNCGARMKGADDE